MHGLIRRTSTFTTRRIEHLYHDVHEKGQPFTLHYGDLSDAGSLAALLHSIAPDEVYNLGAQSHVAVSFKNPIYTANIDAMGVLNLLEAVRMLDKKPRFYQASSSEMYGKVVEVPQSEKTPFYPRSPYGCAKVYGFWQTVNYRESYNLFACNGILFNHESPRRGETFVTRKITRAATRIKLGLQKKLYLGNLEARRDWGFAGDYVDAMWRMLQQEDSGRFRRGHRRHALGARIRHGSVRLPESRLQGFCRTGRALFPPRGSGRIARRCRESTQKIELYAHGRI